VAAASGRTPPLIIEFVPGQKLVLIIVAAGAGLERLPRLTWMCGNVTRSSSVGDAPDRRDDHGDGMDPLVL